MNRTQDDAAQSDSGQHNRKHYWESSWEWSDIQAQKPEPDYLEAEENGACPQADEK